MLAALSRSGARIVGAAAIDRTDRVARVEPGEHELARFEIGSITKVITGTVLARLVLDGVTSLDSQIGDWVDAGENGSITLEELATHTSGLPRLAPNAFTYAGSIRPTRTHASMLRSLKKVSEPHLGVRSASTRTPTSATSCSGSAWSG